MVLATLASIVDWFRFGSISVNSGTKNQIVPDSGGGTQTPNARVPAASGRSRNALLRYRTVPLARELLGHLCQRKNHRDYLDLTRP